MSWLFEAAVRRAVQQAAQRTEQRTAQHVREPDADGISEACREELSTSESLVLSPTVLLSFSMQMACCVVATFAAGCSCGYGAGVHSMPAAFADTGQTADDSV